MAEAERPVRVSVNSGIAGFLFFPTIVMGCFVGVVTARSCAHEPTFMEAAGATTREWSDQFQAGYTRPQDYP